MEIKKNIPIHNTKSKFEILLKMEVGDCVELNNRKDFCAAGNFLRKHFKIKSKQINNDRENYLGAIWRIK